MYKLHIFLWKIQKFFCSKQQILNHFSLKNLVPIFCWNWKIIFPLEKSYRKTLKFRGQYSFKMNTMHIATLSVGITRCFETPITIVKPPHYWNSDLKTLIHSEFQTYHPDITEPKNVQYQNMERTNNSIEDNHKHLYQEPAANNTGYGVHFSQKIAPRVYPLLSYCREKLQFLKNFFSVLWFYWFWI